MEAIKKKHKSHVKAEAAVKTCKTFFESLGFIVSDVQNASRNGHDLIAIKGGRGITIEVKATYFSSRAWLVSKVCKTQSDYVAIVFPSGHIHIDSMEIHLSQCTKDGNRGITHLGKIYE